MAWTTPATWVDSNTPSAADFNTHIRDNFLELAPPLVQAEGDLMYADGANSLARLAGGSSGETLAVNSGATAPEWSSDVTRAFAVREADAIHDNQVGADGVIVDDVLQLTIPGGETWKLEAFVLLQCTAARAMYVILSSDKLEGHGGFANLYYWGQSAAIRSVNAPQGSRYALVADTPAIIGAAGTIISPSGADDSTIFVSTMSLTSDPENPYVVKKGSCIFGEKLA